MSLDEHEDTTLEGPDGRLPRPVCPLPVDLPGRPYIGAGHPPGAVGEVGDRGGPSLDASALHQPVVVVRLAGARSFRRRLMELGLVPGTEVRVRNVAPLGDPLELEVRGCRVSIRRAEAADITIRPVA
ncbi:MAG: hypothetical protein D6798_06650 [Deltaproteobacteria bacterium]|nr:MAG: hypothetical protein D6798_06650 [Deltaproteobacteria bacterium]